MRYLLIMGGMYKGPILQNFERYGGTERHYFPIEQMLFFFGIIVISGGSLLQKIATYNIHSTAIGIVILVSSWVITYFRYLATTETRQSFTNSLPTFPNWYARLENTTSRVERRRIAYMWLRLPFRTRMLYNVNDRLFFIWAELVIISSVDEIEGV